MYVCMYCMALPLAISACDFVCLRGVIIIIIIMFIIIIVIIIIIIIITTQHVYN